jgi:predicted ATPase
MLDWSYELLPEPERRLLRHLAVFVGGVGFQGAIAVLEGAGHPTPPVMEGLVNLVDKSLVVRDPSEPAGRWRLLDTIRAYALQKLVESGEAADAARSHAEFFRDLFGVAEDGLQLQPSAETMARFTREIDNIRAALDWAFSPSGDSATGVILTAHCAPAWVHSTMLRECAERTERALRHLQPDMKASDALHMRLHLALGLSFGMTMEPVERGKAALTHALELAEKLGDRDAQLRALWALWALHFNIGETRVAQVMVERFSSAAGRADDPAALLIAERLRGYVLHHLGEHHAAQQCFERVLELYAPPPDRGYALLRELDQRVLARGMLARVLWLQGYLDQAERQARSTLEDAEALGYQPSICEALRLAVCPLAMMGGDLAVATQAVAKLGDIANGGNCAPFYSVLARCLGAKLSIMQGGFTSAVASLRAEFDASAGTAWAIWHPEFMGALAEGLAGLGRLRDALAVIDQALVKADGGGECYYVPELLRIKGELLLRCEGKSPAGMAEQCFEQALVMSREQNALFWELRTALSLGRLRLRRRGPNQARQILAPVYDRFTEGFETADLRAARALLDS